MSTQTSRILSFIDAGYWAMYGPAFCSMRAIVASWCQAPGSAPQLSRAEKDAAISATQAVKPVQSYQAPTQIAVMNMFGIIAPRAGAVDDISQECCSLDKFSAQYQRNMLDSNISGVIVNLDSPGGSVFQVPETAELIYSLRGLKPNVGVVTGMCASACYFLAAQFSELVACPSADIGSIGVLMRHEDISKMAEAAGIVETYITSPRDGNKSEGNPFTPLADASREYYNSRTDEYYDMFLSWLSQGRNTKTKTIDQSWGRGRMVGAKTALSLGMVDRIGTMQSEIDSMAKLSKKGATRAESESGVSAPMIETPTADQTRALAVARLKLAGA